jgi:hypothetical protein
MIQGLVVSDTPPPNLTRSTSVSGGASRPIIQREAREDMQEQLNNMQGRVCFLGSAWPEPDEHVLLCATFGAPRPEGARGGLST